MKALLMMLVAATAVGALADEAQKKGKGEEKSMTKAEFITVVKARKEKAGKEFKPERTDAKFEKLDKDGNGVLTKQELNAGREKSQSRKSKKNKKSRK